MVYQKQLHDVICYQLQMVRPQHLLTRPGNNPIERIIKSNLEVLYQALDLLPASSELLLALLEQAIDKAGRVQGSAHLVTDDFSGIYSFEHYGELNHYLVGKIHLVFVQNVHCSISFVSTMPRPFIASLTPEILSILVA